MSENPGTLTLQEKLAKIRLLAEDLRAEEDKDFLLGIADEYERLAQRSGV
jgi:hypothetical protein